MTLEREPSSEDSEGDINDDMREMLEYFEAGGRVDRNTRQNMLGPKTNELRYSDRFFAYTKLWANAERELHPGCKKYSKLFFVVRLLQVKSENNLTVKVFEDVLGLIKDTLPEGETLPKSYYEAKKLRNNLGFSYDNIHVCLNDCVLFWREHSELEECPVCGQSRWKYSQNTQSRVPQKVLRHFPLKPRLQRLFLLRQTTTDMRWHQEKRVIEDEVMRHPADSGLWKDLDKKYEWFGWESRNVWLGSIRLVT